MHKNSAKGKLNIDPEFKKKLEGHISIKVANAKK